jgi:hypothetical protein
VISHDQAQELHRLLGGPVQLHRDRVEPNHGNCVPVPLEELERALELAALVVADTEPSPVSYDPCIQGTIDIGGRTSGFLIPLDRGDVGWSNWGADRITLGERVDLLEALSREAKEWWSENAPAEEEDEDEQDT